MNADPTLVAGHGPRLVLGRYRLGEVLGRGGAATVYRALDVPTGHEVAVKEIPIGLEMARRAGAEVRAAGRLEHPGLVRLLDFGEDDHACYLVNELVDGRTLSAYLRDGSLPEQTLIGVVADVLEGLAHAHARGVVHRDLKPANILVDRAGHGRLTDFGIARIAGEAGLTMAGGLVGTVAYMAPEHARGGEAGPASDVYASCLVLYEGLTGTNPIVGTNHADTLRRAAEGGVPSLTHVRRDLPSRLCRAVDAGLDPDPRRRPDADRLAATLRQTIGEVPSAAPLRVPRPPRGAPPARIAAAATAAAVAAVGLTRFTDLRPLAIAGACAAAATAFAFVPWLAAMVAWLGVAGAVAVQAPATGILAGALGLIALAPMRRRGHAAVIPLAAPLAAGLGLAPLIPLTAGLVRGWWRRLWVATTAMATALGWQLVAGADPALDGGRLNGTWPDLQDVADPVAALTTITDAAAARPSVVVAAGILAASSMLVPAVARLRGGLPRALGAVAWVGALVVAVGAAGGSVENAIGAYLPAGILVAVIAAVPWRRRGRDAQGREAVTLRPNTMERLPTA